MRPEQYRLLAARQRTYWWHRARRVTSAALLRRHGLRTKCDWLDLGCGPGGNFPALASFLPERTVGLDLSPIALALAREACVAAELIEGDVNAPLPFGDESFDVVTVFNVLYHQWVASEVAVLREVRRVLRPNGLLLLTEPAFVSLAREMDDAVMSRRRYRHADFARWFTDAGLDQIFGSYFTAFGVPIILAAKLVGRLRGTPVERAAAMDQQPISAPVNNVLYAVALAEGGLLAHGLRLPFGTTLIEVARRAS